MNTIAKFIEKTPDIPSTTAWYLADISEARGMQKLFMKQSPQVLKALLEHALIESAVSSNRIEGVEIENSRIEPVIIGRARVKDRSEEELRGYRDALNLIHKNEKGLSVSEKTIKELHRTISGEIWDSGIYKKQQNDIIQKYPDGRARIRFKTVTPGETAQFMKELVKTGNRAFSEKSLHPFIALAAFNLDFLCIHPFRDGNGRVSRLLLLLQCYHLDLIVGKYISLERIIEENKERYYEALELSSRNWHKGTHDPWDYINFILYIIKSAYREFEERFNRARTARGGKTELVMAKLDSIKGPFTISDLERGCPGVSRDMIKKILSDLKKTGAVYAAGRGPGAQWVKKR